MDIMGPFPLPTRRYRYILVITDIFSKWVEAYATPDKSAESVACILVNEYFVQYGAPHQIHSDQVGEFQNCMVQFVCRMLDIHQTRTSANHPQSDGQVETFNRSLHKMLNSVVENDECNTWDDYIPFLTSAYRSIEHKATVCTPNLLFFGQEVRLPLDILAENFM
jgi:transposase InsO family protein